jgi:molybdopterin synthase sulfur carrier subunit
VKVTVLFFASLREQLGTSSLEVDLPAGVATVAGLKSFLSGKGGSWSEALSEKKLVRAAVNQDMVDKASPIKAGDEVAFFPPVTGG